MKQGEWLQYSLDVLAAGNYKIRLSVAAQDDNCQVPIRLKDAPIKQLTFKTLPKRSGLELLRQIKGHSDYKYIPVLMWSTSLMPNNVIAAYREGAQAFIQKPSCFKQLVQELRVVLKQQNIEFAQTIYEAS